MSIETELKLAVPPDQLARLERHPLLRALSVGRAATHKLYSVYYDTPDLALRGHTMALRLRRVGRQWLQTLKGGGGVQAGLHQRSEWETPVAGEALDFAALKACGAKLPPGVGKQLQPVFVTDFARTVRMLNFRGAVIELGLDHGEIRADGRQRPISELELELKSGEPQQLFELALALLDAVPLEVENTSKAEYGYRLFSGEQPAVRKANFPRLAAAQGVDAALHNLIAACLLQVQANVPGAVAGSDEEYLHQVRVGMRRLRVVLAMAETIYADAELAALHEEVAAMCSEFGRLREWDVFVTQTLLPLRERFPDDDGLREALQAGARQRAKQRESLVQRLQATEYQRLLLRFGAWLCGDRGTEGAAQASLPDFARRMLRKRGKQVAKRGRHFAAIDAGQLHLLRIACKKLRYSAEMFGSLFPAGKVKRYVAALAELQDILGALNDIAVARRLLDGLEKPHYHEALGLVYGWLEHERGAQATKLVKAWKAFARQQPFWHEPA